MTTLTTSKPNTKTNEYLNGEFDAAIGLTPRTYSGDYGKGYLEKVRETGNVPF